METTKTELTSESLLDFLNFYHGLHDATIKNIEYNISKRAVVLNLEVFWAGKSQLSDNGKSYASAKMKNLTLFFEGVIRVNMTEIDTADYIPDVLFKYITKNHVEGTFWHDKPVFVFALGADFDCEEFVFGGMPKPAFENFVVSEKASFRIE